MATRTWEVILDDAFADWLSDQESEAQDRILATARLLSEFGPTLGRPHVDSVKGSSVANLKELRVQHAGEPWRVLFAFDPERRAILLVGGNKTGDQRWYEVNVPIAERRFAEHLEKIRKER